MNLTICEQCDTFILLPNLVNLKSIGLWGSQDLVEIPDLSKAERKT